MKLISFLTNTASITQRAEILHGQSITISLEATFLWTSEGKDEKL